MISFSDTLEPSCLDVRTTQRQLATTASVALRRLVTPAMLVLLPLAIFFAFFNPATLKLDNAGWLIRGSDNGENALGAHAYWHDPAAGASLKTALLNAPDGVPVLYTDSNPLVTLAGKAFAKWLPADAQLVGPFILLSLVLQSLFAWLLLRRHAPNAVALWAGVVLLAFPPTLANRFIHVNLMAHWTILAALYLFLDVRRGERMRWWAPLITITALIHSYLLVMVGAIWASAMLVRFVDGPNRARRLALMQSLLMLGLVATLALWLGVGDQAAAGNFGAFSMPLDALWNPGIGTFSNLLPAHEESPGRNFEGFQYLGAGGLALIAAAIAIARRMPIRDAERAAGHRLHRLVPALIVLAILAVSHMPLPIALQVALDPVRASGRMFWPIGYVLVFMAVLAVFRLPGERAAITLVAVLALQVVDVGGMADAIRAQSREAEKNQLYARTLDPRWAELIGASRSIAFLPGDVTRDLGLFQEIAWRAAKAGRPVTNVYAARTSKITQRRLVAEQAAFARGVLVPGTLYVLISDLPLPAVVEPYKLRLDGVTVIPPVGSAGSSIAQTKIRVTDRQTSPL